MSTNPDAPRPFRVDLDVRFPEVDAYRVVWHGNYVLYCEVARNALCSAAGLTPAEALARGWRVPITRFEVKVRRPARLDDRLEVSCTLRSPETAKLEMDYEVRRLPDRLLLATAFTQQVLLNPADELLLTFPKPVKELVGRILAYQRGERDLTGARIATG
ncbi:MAG: acyl-CoA thioesterase [Thermoanaerobaculia bacterium]|nr:acyl-CoA thioesterase [Thermoanaerobaculia bacterium]